MKKNLFLILLLALFVSSCEDVFDPALENHLQKERMYDDPKFALEFVGKAYGRMPDYWGYSFTEIATDDAVSNVNEEYLTKMATGQWRADNNGFEAWGGSYAAIQYLNILLEESDKVKWANDETLSQLFNERIRGEAYALRAFHLANLLKAHAGWTNSGKLLGVPILLSSQNEENTDFNVSMVRESFEACMQQVYDDYERAEQLLPLDYENISDPAQIPDKYKELGVNVEMYNRAFGTAPRQQYRISRRIAMALRSRAALHAASPAFSSDPDNTTTWERAANYAAEVLNQGGGLSNPALTSATSWKWYSQAAEIDGLADGHNPPEVLWRSTMMNSNDWEASNYPPSIYGAGRINPTQNLVDAFPMKDGYPITESNDYFDDDPYWGRDPRLTEYIVYNGNTSGGRVIWTEVDDIASNENALNATEKSTRTGYYLRKLLRQDVNLNPVSITTRNHYIARVRYTEIYLNYAEAANEAWGPDGTGIHGYSARDVIRAIRKRAGVGGANDPYLSSISGKEAMREMIRNERRIELCFEGFRFWDLRRWNSKENPINLNEKAMGMKFERFVPTLITVENRDFKDYMYYGPIPKGEILKWNNLEQNTGWY